MAWELWKVRAKAMETGAGYWFTVSKVWRLGNDAFYDYIGHYARRWGLNGSLESCSRVIDCSAHSALAGLASFVLPTL
jgi:hypothetical protein